jgi:hypothetical protein
MSFPGILLLAPAAACLLSWLGAGALLPRSFLTGDRFLDTMTRLGVGSAIVSLGLFGLGRVDAFDHWLVVTITLALAVPGAWVAFQALRGTRIPYLSTVTWVLLGLGVAALVLDLVAATAPPTSPDALRYHLGLPKQWLETGAIGDSFWRFESFNPLGTQVLFAQGLALGGGGSAGAVGAVITALAAIAVFGLARELGGGNLLAASIAFALFSLQGLVTWLATSSFAEPGLALYSVLAVWQAVRYVRTGENACLVGAGLLSGAAAGTKYLGLLTAALVLVPVGLLALRAGRTRGLAVALGLAALLALPWYLRNVIEAGNPVYPLVFGGKYVDPGQQNDLREGLGANGLSHPLVRLPLLPFDLLWYGGAFAKGRYVGTAIFLAAPLALFGAGARLHRFLFAGAVVFIAFDLATVPTQARFFLPALGVLAALGGVGIARLVIARPWTRVPLVAAAGLVVVAWLLPSAALTRQLLPVAFGLESRSAFIERVTGAQDVFDAVDRETAGTVGFADYDYIFNYPGRAIAIAAPEFDDQVSRTDYLQRLRASGVTSILTPELQLDEPSPLPEGRIERVHNLARELVPLDSCLRHVATYDANVVTSRSTGSSVKTRFGLLTLADCYRSRKEPTDARSSTSSTASPSSRYSSSVLTDQTS